MPSTESTALLSCFIIDFPKDTNDYEEILSSYDVSLGLSLEELMPYKDDPWWQNIRKTLFLSFWLTLIFTFASACALSILQHGSCALMSGHNENVQFLTSPSLILGVTNSTVT